jgi:hypothetical protein
MERIVWFLSNIGNSPEAVASVLWSAGVRGVRNGPSFENPKVRYVSRNLHINAKLEMGADGTTLRVLSEAGVYEVDLPLMVLGFLQGLHLGLFRELEER